MEIVVIGSGRVGGGLARLWSSRGHQVSALERDGGDAAGSDVVVVAVGAAQIPDAIGGKRVLRIRSAHHNSGQS